MDEWTLNDLLECSVCLERLDTSSKVLPCQHTFCRKCLEEIVSTHKELRCPECRVLVDAKIDDLPPNVLLMRILEGMRNAAPKKRSGVNRLQSGIATPAMVPAVHSQPQLPQQQQQQQQQPSTPAHPLPKQASSPQPCARAIYDYISKEPGDLSFKKGDIILLRKKIDTNWYQGEIGGQFGAFPLTYVQVITPLPNQIPQCKALYDFRMTNDDDEGCLTFSKGEVITVLRRIDENWAEGRLGDRIGIFPLAFVELNVIARALMKLSTNSQPGPSRVAPPTPTSEDTTPLIPIDHSGPAPVMAMRPHMQQPSSQQQQQQQQQQQPQHQLHHMQAPPAPAVMQQLHPQTHPPPALPSTAPQHVQQPSQHPAASHLSAQPQPTASDSSTTGSSSSSTTPNTSSSNTSSSSSTAPSSPTSPPTARPAQPSPQQRDKRHSLSALHGVLPPPQPSQSTHRHSAEILSPGELSTEDPRPARSSTELLQRQGSKRHRRSGSSELGGPPPAPQGAGSSAVATHLPAMYVALYPYKPQKTDELELKKGSTYLVTERCQDGWFKGTSNRTQKCGVFPGNYVTPASARAPPMVQPQLRVLARVPASPSQAASPASPRGGPATPPLEPRASASCSRGRPAVCTLSYTHRQHNGVAAVSPSQLQAPPELPPRSTSPSTGLATVSSSWHGQPTLPSGPTSTVISAVMSDSSTLTAAAPLGRSLSAVLGTGLAGPPPNTTVIASTSNPSPTVKDKGKERKDRGVGLMRRLTSMKKPKSPPPGMDNPVFEDGTGSSCTSSTTATSSPVHPVHVRSGSCPSQLLQALPLDASSAHHRLLGSGSQRLKHKDRPSLATANLAHFGRTGDPGPVGSVAATSTANHRKSNSLDAGSGDTARKVSKQLVPPIRERFRCIVPYPPMSDHELELRVGDIIYVHKKREDGWYKGTQQRTGRTGLFPASFVESC